MKNKEFLTVAEASSYIGVSTQSMLKILRKGEIPYFAKNRKLKFIKFSDLKDWITSNEKAATI